MSKKCDICGREPKIAIKRSHSHIAIRHWKYLNLQTKTINGKKMKVCPKCLKSLKKEKITKKK